MGSREKRGFRNLQRRVDSEEEEEGSLKSDSEEEDEEVLGRKRRNRVADLNKLFEESDEEEKKVDEKGDSEDDLDDFIEDDIPSTEGPKERIKTKQVVKKIRDYSRFGTGLSKDVIQDLFDIFGDGTEYTDLVDEQLVSDMEDMYVSEKNKKKPSRQSVSTADDLIKEMDKPERYKVFVALSPGELEKEALWISERLIFHVKERVEDIALERLGPVVAAALSLIRDQQLEVPFIATHRKEYFQHMLGLNDLWRILDLDEEWRALNRQKEALKNFVLLKAADQSSIVQSYLEQCGDSYEVENLEEYVKQVLRFRATNKSTCLKNEIEPFVRVIAVEPEKFLTNWAMKTVQFLPSALNDSLISTAEGFQSHSFPTATSLIRGAVTYAASELAYHPATSKMFRTAFDSMAAIIVRPTELGEKEIGMNHELAPIKYITEKPISAFSDDQYLRLLSGEKAGLLTINLVIRRLGDLEREWSEFYGIGLFSEHSADDQRIEILRFALHNHVIPRIRKDLLAKLKKQAELYVALSCQYSLQSKLMQAPYNSDVSGIMAISWGDGSPNAITMAVCLDNYGRVVDQAKFPHLPEGRNQDEWERLASFIQTSKPSAVVIGGTSIRTIDLHHRVKKILKDLCLSDEVTRVVYGDDDAARIYMTSPRGQHEFPEFSPLLKYCVSLGRRWLNPLNELTALGKEAVRLPLHLLQSSVSDDLQLKFIERAFINVTNLVGVEIGAIGNSWSRSPLKYVAGCGPVKAEYISSIISGDKIAKRTDLTSKIGPVVFANCASFIRFSKVVNGPKARDIIWPEEPLDLTRIHPENYSLARKIACDATELLNVDNEEEVRSAVIAVMQNPSKLNDLLLEEYAKELEKRLGIPKHLTLLDIKAELQVPYADLRSSVEDTSREIVFESLTDETENTLYIGQTVQAKISRIGERSAYCKLESGLTGIISLHHLPAQSDTGRSPSHPGRVLRHGQTIVASVIRIDLDHFEVGLSMLPDDLKDSRYPRFGEFDPYYDFDAVKKGRSSEKSLSRSQSSSQLPKQAPKASWRPVGHPSYREIGRIEAERLLSESALGEVIVRPSGSFGPDHLTLTWKLDGCDQGVLVQHLDLAHVPGKLNSPHALSVVFPDNSSQIYEDLDELIARYIEPINSYIQDARTCPKYLPVNTLDKIGARSIIEAFLDRERQKALNRIAYCISVSRDKPGALLLSYQPSSKSYHELVDVLPTGYKMRSNQFDKLEALINWFKQNYSRR